MAPRFLQVMGVVPALGRAFLSRRKNDSADRMQCSSATASGAGVSAVILTLAGKTLRFLKSEYLIAGVMPASFNFLIGMLTSGRQALRTHPMCDPASPPGLRRSAA